MNTASFLKRLIVSANPSGRARLIARREKPLNSAKPSCLTAARFPARRKRARRSPHMTAFPKRRGSFSSTCWWRNFPPI